MKLDQKKWQSGVLWATLTTALLVLLGDWGLYDLIGIQQELFQKSITFVLMVLTMFGVINNPDSKNTL